MNKLNTNPQNRNGIVIRGSLFLRNDLISQTRPRDNAPDNIKNKGTPTLKVDPKKHEMSHFPEGMAAYPGAVMNRVLLNMWIITTAMIANALRASK